MEDEEQAQRRRSALGTTKLLEEQKAQMAAARTTEEDARQALDAAQLELEKFERVFADSRRRRRVAASGREQEKARSGPLRMPTASRKRRLRNWRPARNRTSWTPRTCSSGAGSNSTSSAWTTTRRRRRSTIRRRSFVCSSNTARAEAEAASRISFENIDKDNFLLIVAPASGVVTDLTSTQPGDKVLANTPLGGIAPGGARAIVQTEIAESDRAFLREGLPVKLKFNAFPYQRYGVINGTLEYVAPATKPSPQSKQPVYEARVSLERDYYQVGGGEVSAAIRDDGRGRDRRP